MIINRDWLVLSYWDRTVNSLNIKTIIFDKTISLFMTIQTRPADTSLQKIQEVFRAQKDNQYKVANTTAKERIAKLNRLHDTVIKYRKEIHQAMYADFRKPPEEVDLTEIFIITSDIKHTCKSLRSWMKPQKVDTPLPLLGSSSYIQYEPKGVTLIISPWNFPFQLALGPLISAIAAGNTAIIKPSEFTPATSAITQQIIEEVFHENEVALVQGAVETSSNLLDLPFNHIFFTGSPGVGKIVMQAASKHLTSVTLELGGKSPTIIDETANMSMVAKRLTWGKFINNGQICIAPDYVFVHESRKSELIDLVKQQLTEHYGEKPEEVPEYCRIINERHFGRIKDLMDDAVAKGAKIATGGSTDEKENFITPTLLTDVPGEAKIMQEEIFGPVLPILTFSNIKEPVDYIQTKEKPLALYIYSKNKKNIQYILDNTRSGGVCINTNNLHFTNANLPFGGSNNSGIGKGHGWFGFEAFSNAKSVLHQHTLGALDLLMPPYTDLKRKIIDLTIKWF